MPQHLPQILKFLNWNELLVVRTVSRQWYKICGEDPVLNENSGIIAFRNVANFSKDLQFFNNSPGDGAYWRKFRVYVSTVYDMTNATQAEFWDRHGPTMTHLEIENRAITLSGMHRI